MAKKLVYGDDSKQQHIHYILQKSFQSGNINLLIGSGASFPAIKVAGEIEQEINQLIERGELDEATKKKCDFLQSIQIPTNQLIKDEANDHNTEAINNYHSLLDTLGEILINRRTQLLARQITIFTTNYDLFIEKASETLSILRLNDGFNRTANLMNRFEFSPQNFFDITYSIGNLYDYKVEIPSINLVKLHGSLSWKREGETILYRSNSDITDDLSSSSDKEAYINQFAVILPQQHKFQETVINRVYYDLLRIYANQLDKQNTLLVVFGFSFADEHIYEITKRALKNPTLKVIIFSYNQKDADGFEEKFKDNHNVDIIVRPADDKIDFSLFNSVLKSAISSEGDKNVN